MEIVTGVLLGLSTLLFVGPVFFHLLESTFFYGKKAGVLAAIGIIIGDCIYVFLLMRGFSQFINDSAFQKWFALLGGLLLLFLGIVSVLKPKKFEQSKRPTSNINLFNITIKAFLLNFINPFVALIWIGFLTYNQTTLETKTAIFSSLIASLSTIFATDLLKVFLASHIKKLIRPKSFHNVQKVFGCMLIVFAFRLFYHFIDKI